MIEVLLRVNAQKIESENMCLQKNLTEFGNRKEAQEKICLIDDRKNLVIIHGQKKKKKKAQMCRFFTEVCNHGMPAQKKTLKTPRLCNNEIQCVCT